MRLGFGLPVGGTGATPDNVLVLARHAEALGYRSLWVFQRLLCPVAPLNAYYGAPNEAWPEPFRSTLDPIVTLAFIAAQTERVRLGTSVLVAPFYSPVVLGKQLATLDVISRGRLTVGLGIGWSRDEYDAAGTPWVQRGRLPAGGPARRWLHRRQHGAGEAGSHHCPRSRACGARRTRSDERHHRLARIVQGDVHSAGTQPDRVLGLAPGHS